MDLNRIAVFVRVVEAGRFTAAAAALGLRKSSVSRSVAAPEGDLGIRLIPGQPRAAGARRPVSMKTLGGWLTRARRRPGPVVAQPLATRPRRATAP